MARATLPFAIEPARRCDAGPIAQRSRDWIEHGLVWRWRRERVLGAIGDPNTEVIVACRRTSIVGFAAMQFDFDERRAHLMLLGVDPRARRCGAGTALHAWLAEIARQAGTMRIGLELRATNSGAAAFYRRLGYREVVRVPGYYQGQEDAIRMTWRRPLPGQKPPGRARSGPPGAGPGPGDGRIG